MEKQEREDLINMTTLNVKMDNVLTRLDVIEKNVIGRIESLESWQSWSKGIFAVIGVVAALISYIYLTGIKHEEDEITTISQQLQYHIDQK